MPFLPSKRPYGTLLLALGLVCAYALLSRGTAYIPSSDLYSYSLYLKAPYTLFTHLFVHVGIFHLIGNLVPLIIFALLLESVVVWYDVIGVFLFSGILASLVFALTNPFITLVGASAGISGVLAAALSVRPKQSLVLLIATPLLLAFVVTPGLTYLNDWYAGSLQNEHQLLKTELADAVAQSKTNRSPELAQRVSLLNSTLSQTVAKVETTEKGKAREAVVPTDLLVHIYGVVAGLLYMFYFRRSVFLSGRKEYVELGGWIFNLLGKMGIRAQSPPPVSSRRKRHSVPKKRSK